LAGSEIETVQLAEAGRRVIAAHSARIFTLRITG
jgi:hypothetical protein